MGQAWPVSLGGEEYHPVPERWLDAGADDGSGRPRLYAVSAAVGPDGGGLRIRYAHPRSANVLSAVCNAVESPDRPGYAPEGVVDHDETWKRSIVPHGESPEDVLRSVESRHLRRLWGHRASDVPTDGEVRRTVAACSGVVRGCFDD